MFDDSAVESMWLKAHRRHLSPQLKAELEGLGIDLDRPLKPQDENEVLHAGTRLLRRRVCGHLAIGVAVIDGFFDTVVGHAMANLFASRQPAVGSLQCADSGNCELPTADCRLDDTEPHPAINRGGAGFEAEIVESTPPQTLYRLSWP